MTRRRKIIWLSSILLFLAGGIGGYYWYWQSHAIDRKVCQLVYEAAGYPDTRLEKNLRKMKLAFLIKEKPKPRRLNDVENDLIATGPAAMPGLISLLDEENQAFRLYAAMILGKIGDGSAIGPLEKAIEFHPDENAVYSEAIETIKLSPLDRKVCDLVYLWVSYPDTKTNRFLRKAKLDSLINNHHAWVMMNKHHSLSLSYPYNEMNTIGKSATPGLVYLMAYENIIIRVAAIRFITWVGDERAVEPLRYALKTDKEWIVRAEAAIALARIGREKAVVPLLEALRNDAHPQVRWVSVCMLSTIQDAKVVDPLLEVMEKDSSPLVREYACRVVGSLGDKKATDPLKQAMQNDNDEAVRVGATDGLKYLEEDKFYRGPWGYPGDYSFFYFMPARHLSELSDSRIAFDLLNVLEKLNNRLAEKLSMEAIKRLKAEFAETLEEIQSQNASQPSQPSEE